MKYENCSSNNFYSYCRPKKFGHRSNLSRHKAVCQLGDSYVCVFCVRPFDRRDNLKVHIRKRHFYEAKDKEASKRDGPSTSGEKKQKTGEHGR